MDKGERLVFIDYIKVFSTLYIVGYWHLFNYTTFFPEYNNAITNALAKIVLGLLVFVSGFFAGKSAKRSSSIAEFYIKRLVRIYPLYVLAVMFFYRDGLNDGITSLKSLFFLSINSVLPKKLKQKERYYEVFITSGRTAVAGNLEVEE